MAPLVGTALGLSVVAAGAALVLPDKPVFDLAAVVRRVLPPARPVVGPSVVVAPVPAPVVVPEKPIAEKPIAEKPIAEKPGGQQAAPVVAPKPVARPAPPLAPADPPFGIEGLLRPPPGAWSNGTGFFVTSRGTLLTAAHVVEGCSGVRVLSAHMRPEKARVVGLDSKNDVAVLEVAGLESPGWLPVAAPSRDASRLLVLGFPAGALPDTPNETWARLSNAAFEPGARVETDPARMVWFRSTVVTYGYSGGPVVDVASGRAVGMVFGGINTQVLPVLGGQDTVGLKLGPGAVPMLALLSQSAVREGVVPVVMGVEAALELTRRATVQVLCTR